MAAAMAVGDHGDRRAMQAFDAFNGQRARADAGNFCAHGDEAFGDIGNLGFLGRVLNHGGAASKRCCHQDGVSRANRNLGEAYCRADQSAFWRAGDDIAFIDIDLGAERLQTIKKEIHRARADGAATGQRYAGFMAAGQQGPDNPEAGAHF
jgi:hypothetical protein